MKIILLVDMDAFFASVEQRSNPALRGKPMAVIGSGHRTVITTASYEARAYGVRTGMNVYEARKQCPHLILVVGNNDKYTSTCSVLEGVYRVYTPIVEIYSIDEAFLDITESAHLFGGPLAVGARIKEDIRRMFGINATVGMGPNKLIAKLASDLDKPDGLRWISPDEIQDVLDPLPVKELWGIGKRTTERLETLGIRTCGDLGRAPVSMLRNKFGILGERLKAMGMGLGPSEVHAEEEEVKSVGHSRTLSEDVTTLQEIGQALFQLSEKVGSRMRKYAVTGKTISVVIRYKSFETFSKQSRLGMPTNDTHVIYRNAMSIITAIRLREPVRLLGVSLSDLHDDGEQISIFEEHRRRQRLFTAMDGINDRYGNATLTWGPCVRKSSDSVISPAWRPGGIRKSL